MLTQQPNGIVTSSIFSGQSVVSHAYTTRSRGDMKKSEQNRKKVAHDLFGDETAVITAEQVHGSNVGVVDGENEHIAGVDAVVAKVTPGSKFALGVFVADCVPMLLADTKKRIIASIHAGWKGTLGGITTYTVEQMKKLGSNPSDIFVSIGPHISMCHYDVPEERAQKFLKAFDNDPKVVSYFEGAWHVDIGWANYRQLTDAGIEPEHIDAPPTCTACQNDEFFSYRKDSKKTFGEIMGIIGFAYGKKRRAV